MGKGFNFVRARDLAREAIKMGFLHGGNSIIITIAQYPFKGPHRSLKKIEGSQDVFTVICEFGGSLYLLDVDHSDDVKQAIQNHERRDCWEKYRRGLVRYAVIYSHNSPSPEVEEIEAKIRKRYRNIPCPENKS